jgi:hypothetical protein
MRNRTAEVILGITLLGFLAAPARVLAQNVIDLGADTTKASHGHRSTDVEVNVTTKGDDHIIIHRVHGGDSLDSVSESDIVRTGQNIVIDANQVVGGDVVSIGGSVTVLGRIRGDAVAIGGEVRVKDGGRIDGDAVSVGGRVIREPGAEIHGQNVGMSFIPSGIFARRGGVEGPIGILKGIALLLLVIFVVKMLFVLGVGWAARALAHSNMDQFGHKVAESPWRSLLVGILSHFALGILIAVLSITVIGLVVTIPAGIALVPVNAMALALIGALLGQRVFFVKRGGVAGARSWTGSAAIGLGLLSLPVVVGLLLLGTGGFGTIFALVLLFFGITVMTLASATGLGAMVLTLFDGRRRVPVSPAGPYSPPPPPAPPMDTPTSAAPWPAG